MVGRVGTAGTASMRASIEVSRSILGVPMRAFTAFTKECCCCYTSAKKRELVRFGWRDNAVSGWWSICSVGNKVLGFRTFEYFEVHRWNYTNWCHQATRAPRLWLSPLRHYQTSVNKLYCYKNVRSGILMFKYYIT